MGVNIGADARIHDAAPTIGNNVYLGQELRFSEKSKLPMVLAVGANAVVNRVFEQNFNCWCASKKDK